MPDNKTVTFDLTLMREWFHRRHEIRMEDVRNKSLTQRCAGYQEGWEDAMLAAAPTPAAQSAGQEAVSGFVLAEIGRKHFGNPIPKAWYAAARHLLREYAAPVNGGERKKSAPLFMTGWQLLEALDLVAPDRATDPDQMDEEIALQMGDETCHSGPGLYAWEASEPDEGSTFLAGERAAIAANQAKGGA